MAEENKNVETTEGQGAEEQKEQSQPEKKYTDEGVNNISVKNSKKAVTKLMKELGITEKTDRAKVRELKHYFKNVHFVNSYCQTLKKRL
ncbi:MAG: hypothetical protein U0N38_10160 [Acutalibacteraceae bacterium]|jgi:hypothetical protein